MNDESFGTKKARSSFGRGFFKLRGGKQTGSAPNLGTNELQTLFEFTSITLNLLI